MTTITDPEDDGYWWQDLNAFNDTDMPPTAELRGIVSGRDGGIIAYAIGSDHADQIVAALNLHDGASEDQGSTPLFASSATLTELR